MRRIGLLGVGRAGEAVCRLLQNGIGADRRVLRPEVLDSGARGVADLDVLVLALWRPALGLCRRVDALSREHGFVWLPSEFEATSLRVGPWTGGGGMVCFECYLARRLRHDEQSATSEQIYAAYDADPACGPTGYLPSHIRLAAGLVELAFERIPDGFGPAPVGEVSTAALAGGALRRSHVVPRDTCPRCGAGFVPGGRVPEALRDAERIPTHAAP
jgi:bacteriocin biosynthesis cyclodehydratase domain-containing protein